MRAITSPYLKDSHRDELRKMYIRHLDEDSTNRVVTGQIKVEELERITEEGIRQDHINVSIKAYHEDHLSNLLKDVKNRWLNSTIPVAAIESKPEVTALGDLREFVSTLEEST